MSNAWKRKNQKILNKLRLKFLGKEATLELYELNHTDLSVEPSAVVSQDFFVERKTDQVIGAEYLKIELIPTAEVELLLTETVGVGFNGKFYRGVVFESPVDQAGIWTAKVQPLGGD